MRIVITAVLALGFLAAPVASFHQVLGTSSAKAWVKCDAAYRDENKVARTCI